MLKIALTGGIGSGKTTVSGLFSQLGVPIIDADIISRKLLSGSLNHQPEKALLEVRKLFGAHYFAADGSLKRVELRQAVFSSRQKKQQLEAILHPLVYEKIFQQIDHIKAQSPPYILIAIPLLLETRQQLLETVHPPPFDKVLVIDSSVEQQLTRALRRDNSSAEVIQAIIDSQVDRQTRLDAADYVIDNAGTPEDLKKQVQQIHQLLLQETKS